MFHHIGWFTATVLYALIWWTVLFAVLPIGTQPSAEPDATTGWRGAPVRPLMVRKALLTTLVAAVLWVAFVTVIESSWLSFRTGWLAIPNS